MTMANREHKDRLFSFMFGSEENKEWTLSLYNAVNGTSYTSVDEIEITTIKEVMYLGMHNDVSFIMFGEMNLYEQQSTYNPNMPLRMIQYVGNLYEKYIASHNLNKYGSTLLELPVPKLVVFYNGGDDVPDETELRLSDSFPKGSKSDIEVHVRMVNVNYGRSASLLDACRPLWEYSWLIDKVREGTIEKKMDTESAIDRAISAVPADFVIYPFLMAHRAEVKGMLLAEYDEAKAMELFRQDGIREGRAEGIAEGRAEGSLSTLAELVRDGVLAPEEAARRAGLEQDDFLTRAAELVSA